MEISDREKEAFENVKGQIEHGYIDLTFAYPDDVEFDIVKNAVIEYENKCKYNVEVIMTDKEKKAIKYAEDLIDLYKFTTCLNYGEAENDMLKTLLDLIKHQQERIKELEKERDGIYNDYQDIDKFIELSKSNPSNIINGAPVYDNSAPKSRLYGRKITKFWVWIETLGANISDTMCGFRVYPMEKMKTILPILYFKRMGFDTEIIVKSYLNGIDIINLSTKVKYPKNGVSHFNCFKDNVEISLMHTTLCFYAMYKLIFKWRKNV